MNDEHSVLWPVPHGFAAAEQMVGHIVYASHPGGGPALVAIGEIVELEDHRGVLAWRVQLGSAEAVEAVQSGSRHLRVVANESDQ